MDRDSMQRLRLDRRLIGRRGWIEKADLERELSGLPDVSHKVAPPETSPEDREGADAPGDGDPTPQV